MCLADVTVSCKEETPRKIEIICIAGRQTKIDCVAWPFSEYSALFPKLVEKYLFKLRSLGIGTLF